MNTAIYQQKVVRAKLLIMILVFSLSSIFCQSSDETTVIFKSFHQIDSLLDKAPQIALQKALTLLKDDVVGRTDELKARVLNLIGAAYTLTAQYDLSIQYLQDALSIAQMENNLEEEVRSLRLLGKLYWYMEAYDLSLSYTREAMSLLNEDMDKELKMQVYNMMGNALSSKGFPDSAKNYFSKLIPLALENENYELLASSYINLAVLYDQKKDFDQALFYYEKALSTFEYGNILRGQFYSLVNISGIYQQMDQPQQALKYLYQAYPMIDTTGLLSEKVWVLQNLYTVYQQIDQKDSIIKYLNQYYLHKDSLFNKEKLAKINEVESAYKETQLKAELKQKAVIEKIKRTQWILGLSALVVILAALSYIFYIRLEKNRLQQMVLEKEKSQLQADHEAKLQETEQLNSTLNNQRQELSVTAMILMEKNESLQQIEEEVDAIAKEASSPVAQQLKKLKRKIATQVDSESDWEYFKQQFDHANPQFFERLLAINDQLTPKDLKVSAYLRMNLSTKEIAQLMNYSLRGVESMRYRLRKKLELPSEQDLNIWMIQL
ncbi:MAG: tetratricopeptide repeat protein [Bacteroidota bacterium]